MARANLFEEQLRFATADLEPDAIRQALADFAKRSVADLIQSGRASPRYERFVNGRQGVPEEAVELPGPIVYEFSLWEPIITYALDQLRQRSPSKSGRFRSSFIVIAGDRIVTDFDSIPMSAEVVITNFQPYVRKAESGRLGVPRFRIFDGTTRALRRQFGDARRNAASVAFATRWLDIKSGIHPDIPYVLKGGESWQTIRRGANGGGRNRRGVKTGNAITYPSIVMSMVT